MASKKGWFAMGFAAAAICVGIAFVGGVPMFGRKFVGFENGEIGGTISATAANEAAVRAAYEERRRIEREAYMDRHNVTYNRYGCAYYTYSTNGDIKSPVFTKDGPLCDGPVREPHDAER